MYSTQPLVAGLATALFVTFPASAWENLPQKPYGQADLLPAPGQFVITPYYSYTRWLHFYDGKGDKRVIPQELSEEDTARFRSEYRPMAERRIKRDLLLDALVRVDLLLIAIRGVRDLAAAARARIELRLLPQLVQPPERLCLLTSVEQCNRIVEFHEGIGLAAQ